MVNKSDDEELYPSKEQWEDDTDPDEEKLKQELGEEDEEIYDREGREQLVEDGEIEAWEEGFMEGAEKGGKDAKCAYCGEILSQSKHKTVEKVINGKLRLFCCDKHVEEYEEEH